MQYESLLLFFKLQELNSQGLKFRQPDYSKIAMIKSTFTEVYAGSHGDRVEHEEDGISGYQQDEVIK